MSFGFSPGTPGPTAAQESVEADVLWGSMPGAAHVFVAAHIDSTAVGTTSPTTNLLPGLVMAKLDSGAGWVDYDNDATDGSQQAAGILVEEVNLLDPYTAAAADRQWRILVAGPVKAGSLLLLDAQARAQLKGQGIIFDDDIQPSWLPYRRIVTVTGSTTVVAADNNTLFQSNGSGAVTFTLPTPAVGLRFRFLNCVDQNMIIASAGSSDDIIVDGDAGADSITYSTASHKIGSHCEVFCAYFGANLRWFVANLGGTTMTIA